MPTRKRAGKRSARATTKPILLHLRHQDLFDFGPVMWAVTDGSGLILEINPAACRVLGHSRRFVGGTPLSMWTTRESRALLLDHTRRARSGDDVVETEMALKRGAGGTMTVRLFTQRKTVEHQVLLPTVIVDVSEQEALERARWDAERRRERAERDGQIARASEAAKDHLLATVSHELRNPLSPALTAASYLGALPDLPQRASEMAAVIKRSIELEVRLIDDLLDVSRLSRGRLELHLRPVDVREVLMRAVDACTSLSATRAVTIRLDLQATRDFTVGDEARLQQVFWNLLTNAIKFSAEGGVVLVRTISTDDGILRVTVRDYGAGMDAATLESLFDPFEKPGRVVPGSQQGLGLGLTIARGIVEAHGGRIWATSEGFGEGSILEVELATCEPAEVKEPNAPNARDAPDRALRRSTRGDCRILIIEDDPDTGSLLALCLGSVGYDVTIAHTLREGIAALPQSWDIVLSDIGLGDGSGLDIARHAREQGCRPGLLVAVSGFVTASDIAASRQAGFDYHLAKPVDLDQLLNLLDSVSTRA